MTEKSQQNVLAFFVSARFTPWNLMHSMFHGVNFSAFDGGKLTATL